MSRLLDMLRRHRRGDGPPCPHDHLPAQGAGTALHRAVVLDTLSGTRHAARWHRRPLPAAFIVVAGCAIVLYLAVGRTGRDRARPSSRPLVTPASVSAVATSPRAGVQEPGVGTRSEKGPAGDLVLVAAPKEVTRRLPARASSAAPILAPGGRQPGDDEAASHATAPASGSTEEDRFARALHLQRRGDLENAIVEYRAVLRANEANARAHNNLGVLYQAKGWFGEATGEFRRAVAIDPAYDKARNNLGAVLMHTGDIDEAAAEFRRILAAHPNNQEAMINLGLSQRAGGHREEARETLIRAVEIDDRSAVAHYNLALLYEDAREIARALEHYEAYLKYAAGGDATQVAAVRERCQALRQRLIRF